ncbi:hypothetical protein F2P81_017084 [Scophthalmus maximus]|uniref:Uncharacterized protein n=1 Tax=Scophthalmus maximus TaxID=52904 RepID=A0A6A4S7N1_SCOMX|nr:hypothetical protein F2P81_017084 [Scophthalmus maximus]
MAVTRDFTFITYKVAQRYNVICTRGAQDKPRLDFCGLLEFAVHQQEVQSQFQRHGLYRMTGRHIGRQAAPLLDEPFDSDPHGVIEHSTMTLFHISD